MRIVRFAETIDQPWVGEFPMATCSHPKSLHEAVEETDLFGDTLTR